MHFLSDLRKHGWLVVLAVFVILLVYFQPSFDLFNNTLRGVLNFFSYDNYSVFVLFLIGLWLVYRYYWQKKSSNHAPAEHH